MKKNTPEYRLRKKKQDARKLRQRTKKRRRKKCQSLSKVDFEKALKSSPAYDAKQKTYTCKAPEDLSIDKNPAETIRYYRSILDIMMRRTSKVKRILIDISEVAYLQIDALMYLLAIMYNRNWKNNHIVYFAGNVPEDEKVKRKFEESGFYEYVKHIGNHKLTRTTDNLQITCGKDCNTDVAREISDFVCKKANISKRECRFLYCMIIELMSNTHKHAYKKGLAFAPMWYCYVEYDRADTISFTFMDTGIGIPSTAQKNFKEAVKRRINFFNQENRIVISAFNGDFRTATGLTYRGKGLPKIREYCAKGNIKDLHIVSNKADVRVSQSDYQGYDLRYALKGTLYYWNIDIKALGRHGNENQYM